MNVDKQALRQLATDAHELGIIKRYTKGIEANKRFLAAATPLAVLALLDELEAMHKYVKGRDEENEDLMLTVGRLRIEKEATEKRIAETNLRNTALALKVEPMDRQVGELTMWVKRLAHSLRKANPDSKLQSDAMDYLSRKGLISVEDVLR